MPTARSIIQCPRSWGGYFRAKTREYRLHALMHAKAARAEAMMPDRTPEERTASVKVLVTLALDYRRMARGMSDGADVVAGEHASAVEVIHGC